MTNDKKGPRKNKLFFHHSDHQTTILTGLHSLRNNELLYDVTLKVDEKHFKAHKVVLAACSDYFRVMFTKPMLESRQSEVALNGMTKKGFTIVLDYIYTSKLVLDPDNVQDVLSTATHIQLQSVVDACANFLENQIDVENCVDIANIAETYDLSMLKDKAYMYMTSNLANFSDCLEFYRLYPLQLKTLLAYNYPVNCSEVDILKFVFKWFLNRSKSREVNSQQISSILEEIDFHQITSSQLESITDSVFISAEDLYLREKIWSKCHSMNLKTVDIFNSSDLVNSRGMELAILKIGGFGLNGMTNVIMYCLVKEMKWRHLTTIPHVEQCNFGSAVYMNDLYIIGGCFNQSLQETIHAFGFKYNPTLNKWSSIAPMATERCRFSLHVVGQQIYAIGGSTEMHEDGSRSCERYDPVQNTWTQIPPLKEHRTQHAGVVYEVDANTKWLFISGGIDKDTILSSVCYYDTKLEKWQPCRSLLMPRADHAMFLLDQKIYACGGWTDNFDTGSRGLVETIDVYDVNKDVWEVLTQVPHPRFHAGIVAVNDKIYFIGGTRAITMFNSTNTTIHCYDITNDTWTTEGQYPEVAWEHNSVHLYVPKYRDGR